jgi:hypothetical protein
MKPSALRIERLLAKVEAELVCSARPRTSARLALRARTQGFEQAGMDGAVFVET